MVLHHLKLVFFISLALALPSATAAQLLDGLADPLPQRGVARLGSGRLRHGGQVGRVMFSPDGRKLASWAGLYQVSEGIAIWEAATGKEMRRVVQPGAWLEAWAWTPDGRLMAVLKSREGKKHSLFDFSAARVEGQALPERDDGDDNRFAVSPSGKVLAVSSHGRDGRGYMVEFRELIPDRPARDAKVLGVAQGNLDYATVLRFTPDGQKLIVFTPPNRPQRTQRTAVVWDVETARELGRMNLTDKAFGPGQSVDLSNERIAAVLPIGTVRLYDLITREEERLAEADDPPDLDDARTAGGAVAVRFSLDGRTLVTAGPGQRVRFWNVRDRKKIREIALGGYGIEEMDLSHDGKVLALGGRDGVVRLLDTATGAEICPQPGHKLGVLSVALSADSRIAATTGLDRSTRIWDLERAKELRVITCDGYLRDCALTPDSKTVLAGVNPDLDPDHAVLHLWDLNNGEEAQTARLTGTKAESVRFAPDGRTLFTLSGETITLRSWPQGDQLREIKFPPKEPRGFTTLGTILAISPDGALLAWNGD
jgi:WD40 repeat protein